MGSGCSLLKSDKQARLVERKVCCVLDASNCKEWDGGGLSKIHSHCQQAGAESSYRWAGMGAGRGATCRNSTVSLDSRPGIGHQWSDQNHLVLGIVNLQFQGQFFPISLWPVL